MKRRIRRFSVLQTSWVAAIILFCVMLIFMIPMGLIFSIMGKSGLMPGNFPGFGGAIFFVLPFFYGIVGFVMTAISCLIYNLIAGWTGGIELEFEPSDEDSAVKDPLQ